MALWRSRWGSASGSDCYRRWRVLIRGGLRVDRMPMVLRRLLAVCQGAAMGRGVRVLRGRLQRLAVVARRWLRFRVGLPGLFGGAARAWICRMWWRGRVVLPRQLQWEVRLRPVLTV